MSRGAHQPRRSEFTVIGLPTTDTDPSVRRAHALRLLLAYVAESSPAPATDPHLRERR